MNVPAALHAFAGYGIELEYMIVDRRTLSALPIADELLRQASGARVAEVKRGQFGWSNELALHLVEIKNTHPYPSLEALPADFQAEIQLIDRKLEPLGARLMPGAMHPWMDPSVETRLWPHDGARIYRSYDRIFDCKAHGWANLQSMHLNLPFAGDEEFSRLHAAIRLLLPIIPALAASSPIVEARPAGFLDFRMESYRNHQAKIPSTIGQVIPDTISSQEAYQTTILAPMYRELATFDPEGILRHEWLNARGAIPRFDRQAIEIRVTDVQECPQADLAIAAAISAILRTIYQGEHSSLFRQQAIGTDKLVNILHACTRDADRAVIGDAGYLQLLGFPAERCQAGELWHHLIENTGLGSADRWREPLDVLLRHGPLARRILRAVGPQCSRANLHAVYLELCDCLEAGRMFTA